MDRGKFSDLIGSIYDCAVDPGLWPTALEAVCEALDSAAATLAVADFVTGEERALVNVGISEEYLSLYRERYQCVDLFLHGLMLQDVDQPARSADLVSDEELLKSRIYREWAAPQGFRDTLMTPLIKQRARLGFIGLTRRLDQRRYDETDRALMASIAPHVRRAVTIADLIGHKEIERDRFLAIVNALSTAALVVDRDGRLIHSNPPADALLRAGSPFVLRKGLVETADRAMAAAFRKARRTCDGIGEAQTLRVDRDGESVTVTVLPLVAGRRLRAAEGTSCFAIFVQDADAAAPLGAEVIGRAFNLTAAELRVLLGLVEGATPQDIASQYGISSATVKTQLKSLFAKTGAKRQAELVKLALSATPLVR
jgi:DNA-binding CsgD family transcriptional regulator/PAS domain-containing protein